MKIEYRKLIPSETKLYRKIRLESVKIYPTSFCSTYDEQKSKPKLDFETYIEQKCLDKFIIGAFCDERLIGICGFFRADNKRSQHRGEIIQMYVNPNYQCKNIGFTLLQVTVNEAFKINEIEQIELGVLSSSKVAEKMYERTGFTEFGFQKNYLKENNNWLHQRLMVLYRSRYK